MKTNLSQLAMIVFCPEHHKIKLMSSHLLSSLKDLAYFLCVDKVAAVDEVNTEEASDNNKQIM